MALAACAPLLLVPDRSEPSLQIAARHVVHHDKGEHPILFRRVEAHDVGMIEARQSRRFPAEAPDKVRIVGQVFTNQLDGDVSLTLRVKRKVDVCHAPAPQEPLYLITFSQHFSCDVRQAGPPVVTACGGQTQAERWLARRRHLASETTPGGLSLGGWAT